MGPAMSQRIRIISGRRWVTDEKEIWIHEVWHKVWKCPVDWCTSVFICLHRHTPPSLGFNHGLCFSTSRINLSSSVTCPVWHPTYLLLSYIHCDVVVFYFENQPDCLCHIVYLTVWVTCSAAIQPVWTLRPGRSRSPAVAPPLTLYRRFQCKIALIKKKKKLH